MNGHKLADWVSLNILNTIYLIKDWVLLQIGVQVSVAGVVDKAIAWLVGITIVAFNIVRIVKYIIDIKQGKKNETE